MKKYFALIITAVVILTCFTACKPKIKDGTLVTDAAGKAFAAVTEQNGAAARDEAGNIILLVTDANGRNVKDENGEYKTEAIAIDHALVIGTRIECPYFSIEIPEGWSDSMSYSDLILSNNSNEEEIIKVMTFRDKKLSTVMEEASSIIDTINTTFSDCVYTNKQVKVCGFDGTLVSAFVPNNSSGGSTYMGYIFFERNNIVYSCMLASDTDMGERLDDILGILNTIQFR